MISWLSSQTSVSRMLSSTVLIIGSRNHRMNQTACPLINYLWDTIIKQFSHEAIKFCMIYRLMDVKINLQSLADLNLTDLTSLLKSGSVTTFSGSFSFTCIYTALTYCFLRRSFCSILFDFRYGLTNLDSSSVYQEWQIMILFISWLFIASTILLEENLIILNYPTRTRVV